MTKSDIFYVITKITHLKFNKSFKYKNQFDIALVREQISHLPH